MKYTDFMNQDLPLCTLSWSLSPLNGLTVTKLARHSHGFCSIISPSRSPSPWAPSDFIYITFPLTVLHNQLFQWIYAYIWVSPVFWPSIVLIPMTSEHGWRKALCNLLYYDPFQPQLRSHCDSSNFSSWLVPLFPSVAVLNLYYSS